MKLMGVKIGLPMNFRKEKPEFEGKITTAS